MNYEEAKNICTELMQFCKEEAYEYRAELMMILEATIVAWRRATKLRDVQKH